MKKIFTGFILSFAVLANYVLATDVNNYEKNISNHNKPSNIYNGSKRLQVEHVNKLKNSEIIADLNQLILTPFVAKSIEVILDERVNKDLSEINFYTGKMIDSEKMMEILTKVTKHFLRQDYLLPRVSFSKADLKEEKIKIKVELLSLDDVIVLGDAEENDLVQEYAKKIIADVPTKTSIVQRYLALMNDLPGVDVNYRLKEAEDKVELIIYTSKKKWSAYVGLDGYGSDNLGKYQVSSLIQSYSPFNKNESFVIHGGTTNHPNLYNDYGINFFIPINSEGSKLHLSAFHTEDNPSKKDTIEAKTNQGDHYRIAFTHHILIKTNLDLEAEMGLIYKNININQQVDNKSVPSKDSKFWMGDIGFKYLFKDHFKAKNMFTVAFIQGLNGKYQNYLNDDQINKRFSVGRLNFFRELPLSHNFALFTHLCLAYSSKNVPDSEKSTLGGRDFGRGYSSVVIDGTKLAAFAAELRYNINLKKEDFIHHVQPYIFHDIGNLGVQKSKTNINKIESAGLGVRFKMKHNFETGLEAAFPFKRNYVVEGNEYKASTNYSFFINKIIEF